MFVLQLSVLLLLCCWSWCGLSHPVLWVGGVTETVARFRANGLLGEQFTLKNSENAVIFSDVVRYEETAFELTNLQPNTTYFYQAGSEKGQFHTFSRTFQPLRIGVGSCTSTPSTSASWISLKRLHPDLFIITGDLFYYDITENSTSNYAQAYHNVFESQIVRDFFHSTVIAYMWDDHDFGPNNSDGTAPGKVSARLSYQSYVPHYPFAVLNSSGITKANIPIYQSFSVNGNQLLVILTDLRSESLVGQHIMEEDQIQWLFGELTKFNDYDIVLWVSSRPWIGAENIGDDFWGGFPQQRRRISNFISSKGIDNLIMVAGDAHMVAVDDGQHSDYSTNYTDPLSPGAGFPVFQAAALDRFGSIKGGPFSHGCYTHTLSWVQQYGLLEIYKDKDNTTLVTFTGYRTNNDHPDTEEKLVTYTASVPLVKKGIPGSGKCNASYFPLFEWLVLAIPYAFFIVFLIVFTIYHCTSSRFLSKKTNRIRAVITSIFFLVVIVLTVADIVYFQFGPGSRIPFKPYFLPYQIGWVVLGIDVLYLLWFLIELCYRKKHASDEDIGMQNMQITSYI